MLCPRCKTELISVQHQGVEIDRCPGCQGIWLDRGELEKLVRPVGGEKEPRKSSSFLEDLFNWH